MSGFFGRNKIAKLGYYYLCCWNTFCTIATINIFFRCPTWESALSFVDTIFLSGGSDYQSWIFGTDTLPTGLFDAFGWVITVFLVHEAQRYLSLKERILESWIYWIGVCFVMFWFVASFGISGPQFILLPILKNRKKLKRLFQTKHLKSFNRQWDCASGMITLSTINRNP